MKIAFIVQRYGTEILGGSEYHCRLIAERLAEHHQVEVLTTCARDYITWAERIPGRRRPAARRDGAPLRRRRARATSTRSTSTRTGSSTTSTPRHDEMEWLKQQGPWTPGLVEYLERQHRQLRRPDLLHVSLRHDRAWASGSRRRRACSFPTAHDEPAIRLGIYEDVFASAAGHRAGTPRSSGDSSARQFHLRTVVEDVVGCGVDLPEGEAISATAIASAWPRRAASRCAPHLEGPANAFRRRHRMHGPFVLYGGRIDPGKGCEELLEYFQTYAEGRRRRHADADGHQADAAAGRPARAVRRHCCRTPSDCTPSRPRSVVVVPSPVRESVAAGARSLRGRDAGAGQRTSRGARRALPAQQRGSVLRGSLGVRRGAEADRCATPSCAPRWAQTAESYVNRHYRWSMILSKYERLFSRLRGTSARRTAAFQTATRPGPPIKERSRRCRTEAGLRGARSAGGRGHDRPRGQRDARRR